MSVNVFGLSGKDRSSDINTQYVDQKFTTLSNNLATKVNKSGDTIYGDLKMGNNKITSTFTPNADKVLTNKAYVDSKFMTLEDNLNSKLCKAGDFMTGQLDMNRQQIIGLENPTDDDEACNKRYIDSKITSEITLTKAYIDSSILNIGVKNKVGYVPILNSNLDSKYGFRVAASSETENENKHAFNVFSYKRTEWITNNVNKSFWIQIHCPESVQIYRFALRGKNSGTDLIYKWKLQGSNNIFANRWDNLYIAENEPVNKVVNYYYIQNNERYSTYRIFVHEAEGENPGLSYWQLYTVDDVTSD